VEIDFDKGIARIPGLILALGAVGTGVSGWFGGFPYAAAFFAGAGAAYFNFRLLERFVNRLGELAAEAAKTTSAKPPKASGVCVFIQFALFVLGAFVILRISGFNVLAALYGFLVCPAAVIVEIFYELITYGHS